MTSPLTPYRPPIISRRQVETIGLYLLLTLIAILMLLPLLWLISTALKSPTEDIFQIPPRLLPEQPTFENFSRVWNNPGTPFISYFANSAIVAGLTVSFNLLFCSLAAYPLARLDFKGRDLLFSLVVATIMIPFQIVMIPLYVLMVKLGLKGSYLGVVLPSLASAFGIFLMRQAFQSVPKELEEAGRLDGCSELGIWWHIMIPSVRPALVTLAIFVFIGSWSDFLWPLLMLIDLPPEAHTLPIGVSLLAGSLSLDWRLVAAGSVLSIAPVVLFFLIMQRYVVPSEAASGVKG
jgi:putative chitobiose transport system permease protein